MARKRLPIMLDTEFSPPLWHSRYFIRHIILDAVDGFASIANGKLLDFGCGSKPYRSLFNVDEYIGLDFENPGHSHIGEQIDIIYDGKQIPADDGSFDCVLATEVFEHIFDLPSLLLELNRVTKIGGMLFLTCPFAWIEHEQPYDYARYTQYALKYELEKAGYEVVFFKKGGCFRTFLGALSETFIKKHTQLLPGQMVVVSNTDVGANLGQWHTDCPTLFLNSSKIGRVKNIFSKLGFDINIDTIRVKRFLKKYNVGYALGEWIDYSLRWVDVCADLEIPFYVHSYGYDISENLKHEKWRKKYLELNHPIVKAVINEGEFVKQRLVELGISESKIHRITTCPLKQELFYERQHNRVVTVLCYGRMVGKKSPILNIEVFSRVFEHYRNIRLVYIGGGEQMGAVIDFLKAKGIKDVVTLLGNIPHQSTMDFIKQADILLSHNQTDPVTGDEEGKPLAIMEAMAWGLPVVTTNHAGIPDCITDGVEGFLVNEGDLVEMQKKLSLLVNDYDLRIQMGRKGWSKIYCELNWENEKKALLNLMMGNSEW